MNNPMRTEVFVSYSHRDDVWREELLYTLSPYLQRERTNVSVWVDKAIKPGDKWDQEIRDAIGRARVAVLLVSKYFLASDYVKDHELPLIFSMQADGLRIIWVPLSACLYKETDLGAFQAAFDPSHPLDARNISDQQKALVKVCEAIREAFQNRQLTSEIDSPLLAKPPVAVTPATVADQSLAHGLLFCVMAVQNEWIDSVQFSKACSEWAADKSKSLPEILLQRQWICAEDSQVLEALLQRRLSRHDGDAEQALLRSAGSFALQVVEQSHIPELQRSLDRLAMIAAAEEISIGWTPNSSNRYQWMALHAAGSFSEVHTGLDRIFNRPVALKTTHTLLPAEVASHHQRRLVTEAQIAGQLEHPHIVPVYDLAKRESDDEPFYVMRMLRGPTLADEIRRHHDGKIQERCDTLERRRLIESLLCVCHAMEYAHARGVLHLDLKPHNIALGDYREVYLLDWGLSRPIQSPNSVKLAKVRIEDTLNMASDETQGAIGTPGYMSPEQARGELASFGERTDVYGLGAILYEILTGAAPHREQDTENDFEIIRTKPVPNVREVAKDVPAMIAAICDKALAFEAKDRHATVEDLSIELRRYLDDEPLLGYRANVEQFELLLAQSPDRHDFREGIARNLFNLGLIQNGMLRHAAAENSLNKALEHYEQLVQKFSRDPRLRSELAVVWLHLYYVLTDARKFEQAEVAKRNALEEYQRLSRLSPDAGRHGYLKTILSRLDGLEPELDHDAPLRTANNMERTSENDGNQPVEPLASNLDYLIELLQSESDESERQLLVAAIDRWRGWTEQNNGKSLREAVADVKQARNPPQVPVAEPKGEGQATSLLSSDAGIVRGTIAYFATLAPSLADDDREFGEAVVGPRYRILRPFAVGGLGAIYVAYDEALRREVALKELKSTNADHASFRAQFLKEARITALLDHPGIVPIYSLGTYSDDRPFYAMKLVKGKSLDDAIREWHSHTPSVYSPQSTEFRSLLWHMVSVCKTLAFAHSRGVAHCDIKPANVLIGPYGETLVIDWGLARTIRRSNLEHTGNTIDFGIAPSDRFDDGHLFGTLAYMSPEQASKKTDQLDERSDVFSLGASLYHLLVGTVPGLKLKADSHTLQPDVVEYSLHVPTKTQLTHSTGTFEQILAARIRGDYIPPRSLKAAIPKALEAICTKAMARQPEDRYNSALELAEALERWLTSNSNWRAWFNW